MVKRIFAILDLLSVSEYLQLFGQGLIDLSLHLRTKLLDILVDVSLTLLEIVGNGGLVALVYELLDPLLDVEALDRLNLEQEAKEALQRLLCVEPQILVLFRGYFA